MAKVITAEAAWYGQDFVSKRSQGHCLSRNSVICLPTTILKGSYLGSPNLVLLMTWMHPVLPTTLNP